MNFPVEDTDNAGSPFKQAYEKWYVRNYGTAAEREAYGFPQRAFYQFNLVELSFFGIVALAFWHYSSAFHLFGG